MPHSAWKKYRTETEFMSLFRGLPSRVDEGSRGHLLAKNFPSSHRGFLKAMHCVPTYRYTYENVRPRVIMRFTSSNLREYKKRCRIPVPISQATSDPLFHLHVNARRRQVGIIFQIKIGRQRNPFICHLKPIRHLTERPSERKGCEVSGNKQRDVPPARPHAITFYISRPLFCDVDAGRAGQFQTINQTFTRRGCIFSFDWIISFYRDSRLRG